MLELKLIHVGKRDYWGKKTLIATMSGAFLLTWINFYPNLDKYFHHKVWNGIAIEDNVVLTN